MHHISHLAHRGASASRTTPARWHPYTNTPVCGGGAVLPPTCSLPSPVSSFHGIFNLQTPPRSVAQAPASSSFGPSTDSQSTSIAQKGSNKEARSKFVSLLIDQAVDQLDNTWPEGTVPEIFLTPKYSTNTPECPPTRCEPQTLLKVPNGQLPSPESPLTRISGGLLPMAHTPSRTSSLPLPKRIAPLRMFVHEVLRRSRTSCSTLQIALCYVAAVRHMIPGLSEMEKRGEPTYFEPEGRIEIAIPVEEPASQQSQQETQTQPATPEETFKRPASLIRGDSLTCVVGLASTTIPARDVVQPSAPALPGPNLRRKAPPPKPTTPLPDLPHPLLCPRRTFMAALILASKFLQDKSYSNRAWAKLSGLPPREISRCERALGDALGWRLWVGRPGDLDVDATPSFSQDITQAATAPSTGLSRTRTEGILTFDAGRSSGSGLTRARTEGSLAFGSSRTSNSSEFLRAPTMAPELSPVNTLSSMPSSMTMSMSVNSSSPCPTLLSSSTPSIGSDESNSIGEFPTPESAVYEASAATSKAANQPSFGALPDVPSIGMGGFNAQEWVQAYNANADAWGTNFGPNVFVA